MSELTPYQLKALDFNNHIALTANAGSGKTFVLSRRFVKIITETNEPISNVVAITFTEKAASELFVKISREINSQIENETDETKKKKLIKIRSELINARISTIHSFCADILREYATEAGIDSSFNVIDEQQQNDLIDSVIDEFINKNLQSGSEKFKELIRIFGSISLAEIIFKKIILNSHLIFELTNNFYIKTDLELENYYSSLMEKLFNEYFKSLLPNFIKNFSLFNNLVSDKGTSAQKKYLVEEYLNKLNESNTIQDVKNVISKLSEVALTKKNTILARGYLTKEIQEKYFTEVTLVEKFIQEFLHVYSNTNDSNKQLIKFAKQYIGLFYELTSLYEEKKRKMGCLDFEDLMTKTEKVISNENVLNGLRERYKYIMIDEYQDTNEIQYNIFMPILDKLNKGNLFIVGDEKQSIYMFRNAELDVFNKTKIDIGSKGKESLLQLPHSFRLSPKLSFFTNYIFEKLFAFPNKIFNEVENNSLVCTRNDFETGGIELLLSNEENNEYQLIAEKIFWLVKNRNVKFREIAILSRRKSPFIQLEKEFIRRNIPYITVGGQGFYQRQIIYDINNYLMFLTNPQNDLSLIGILRSPFFYLSDEDIFLISNESGNSFFEKLIFYGNKNTRIKKISDTLFINIKISNEVNPVTLIKKLLYESGYYSIIASRINAEQELANLEKLFSIIQRFYKTGFKTLFDLSEFLKSAAINIEDEGQAAVTSEIDAIKLMTIHKAKGLEFKVVFLIDANSYLKNASVNAKDLIIDKEIGLLAKLPESNYFAEYTKFPIINYYEFRQKKKEIAELKRLFYVAVTRAIDYLFISATIENYKVNSDSFMSFLYDTFGVLSENKKVKIDGSLDLMLAENDYKIKTVSISLEIPINDLPENNQSYETQTKQIIIPKKSLNRNIQVKIRDEVISASKIAVFSQCPRKYNLIYNIGIGEILNSLNQKVSEVELEDKEDDKIPANIFGSIIHAVLEKNPTMKNLDDLIKKESAIFNYKYSLIESDKMEREIKELLINFLQSDVYQKISSYKKYFNEYQIYLRENDYFLYGIIDKIILDNEKLIIVDYKTDDVNENKVSKKLENYINQLLFYAFIASKYFDLWNGVELKLIFVKRPELSYSKMIDSKEILNFGGEIYKIITEIRKNNFNPNLTHCKLCQFNFDENCIMPV